MIEPTHNEFCDIYLTFMTAKSLCPRGINLNTNMKLLEYALDIVSLYCEVGLIFYKFATLDCGIPFGLLYQLRKGEKCILL